MYESWKLLIRGLLIKEKLARKADQGLTKGHVHKFSKKTSKDKITGMFVVFQKGYCPPWPIAK